MHACLNTGKSLRAPCYTDAQLIVTISDILEKAMERLGNYTTATMFPLLRVSGPRQYSFDVVQSGDDKWQEQRDSLIENCMD